MDFNIINYVLLFALGTFFGSFLNVIADRSVKGGKIVNARSKCDFCQKELKPQHLIPLLSFIFQGRKCAYCKTPLSFYYPFSEILSGLLFVLAAAIARFSVFNVLSIQMVVIFLFFAIVFSIYEIILLTDLKYLIIPDKIVLPSIGFVALFQIGISALTLYQYRLQLSADELGKYLLKVGFFEDQVVSAVKILGINFLSAILIASFFLFLVWFTKGRGMGGGDIRLALLIGLVNSFPYNLLATFLGFFIGAVVSVLLIIARKKTLKSIVPFGPFLILGSILCLVWGNEILNWYFNLF